MFRCTPVPGLALLVIAVAHAQPALPAASGDSAPADAHRSALEGYKPFADQPVAPWRQTNDTVRDIGGWRAYAREAQAAPAAPAASSAASAAAPAASSPHAGHH